MISGVFLRLKAVVRDWNSGDSCRCVNRTNSRSCSQRTSKRFMARNLTPAIRNHEMVGARLSVDGFVEDVGKTSLETVACWLENTAEHTSGFNHNIAIT